MWKVKLDEKVEYAHGYLHAASGAEYWVTEWPRERRITV